MQKTVCDYCFSFLFYRTFFTPENYTFWKAENWDFSEMVFWGFNAPHQFVYALDMFNIQWFESMQSFKLNLKVLLKLCSVTFYIFVCKLLYRKLRKVFILDRFFFFMSWKVVLNSNFYIWTRWHKRFPPKMLSFSKTGVK